MTEEQINLSQFLTMPVADGLDAVPITLELFRTSGGETKKAIRRILESQRLMFSKLAPHSLVATRWEELDRQIFKAIG